MLVTLQALALLVLAPTGDLKIVIDAGHGGVDSGGLGNGLVEKELNLDVALRFRDLLLDDTVDTSGGGSWQVALTRSSDTTVSLQARVDLANAWPADRFISIHHNAFGNPAANGTETYSFAEGTFAADLRDHVQEELVFALGLTDRGSKTANFFVLRETTMPAILSEGGFVTSPVDAAVLADPARRQAAAEAHLYGLQRHFGITPHLPFPDPEVYCTPKLNSGGCLPRIGSSGSPSATTGFSLTCTEVTGSVFGLLFWSTQANDVPFMGGHLCLAGPLKRTPPVNSGGSPGPNCSGWLQRDLTASYLAANSLGPGAVLYAQWWYRDSHLPVDPIGLSAGLRVVIRP